MLNSIIDQTLEAEFALRQRHPEREEVYDDHRRRSAAVISEGGRCHPPVPDRHKVADAGLGLFLEDRDGVWAVGRLPFGVAGPGHQLASLTAQLSPLLR